MKRKVLSLLLVLALLTGILTLSGCEGLEYFTDYPSGWDTNDTAGDSTTATTNQVQDYTTTTTTQSSGTSYGYGEQPSTSALLSSSVVRDHKVQLLGNGRDVVNVMVYMNGSDLESQNAMGTADLKEMLAVSKTGNVNIFVQTIGTKTWHYSGISNRTSQRFLIKDGQMYYLEKDLGSKQVGDPNALAEFIKYCDSYAVNHPESGVLQGNRNMLILWDHGGGIIYGYGSDDTASSFFNTSDSLGVDELQQALVAGGVYFDFIGFDACLMGGLETACALYDFADYFIASEDFESAYGWEYQRWLTALGQNSSLSTPEIGKIICDDFVVESSKDNGILALVDLAYMKLLYSAWTTFAYASEDQLRQLNYSQQMTSLYQSNYSIKDYQAVDIMAAASTMNTDEAKALQSALSYAMVYMNSTTGDRDMTGLSVTLPYNKQYTSPLVSVLTNCGFDQTYIDFIKKFGQNSNSSSYYDWGNYSFGGWDDYTSDYNWNDYGGWGSSMSDWMSLFGWDSYGYGSGSSGGSTYGNDYGYYNYGDYGYGYGGYGYGDYGYGYGDYGYGSSNNDYYDSYYGSGSNSWYQSSDWGALYDYFDELFDW